jgi:NAD-dependent DNA ligase
MAGSVIIHTIDCCLTSLLKKVTGFLKGPSGPKCPECSSVLIDEACPNLDCPIKVAEWLLRWCSSEGVDIPALGQAEAAQLAGLRLVLHPGELYELGPGDWERLEGVTSEQLEDIRRQIAGSKSANPSAVLYGLYLPKIDEFLAKRLVVAFGDIDALREAEPELLQAIDGVDEPLALEIRHWFRDSVNRKALKMLEENGFSFAG